MVANKKKLIRSLQLLVSEHVTDETTLELLQEEIPTVINMHDQDVEKTMRQRMRSDVEHVVEKIIKSIMEG